MNLILKTTCHPKREHMNETTCFLNHVSVTCLARGTHVDAIDLALETMCHPKEVIKQHGYGLQTP